MTALSPIHGQGSIRWSDALEAATQNEGADPYLVWTQALLEAGSETSGPDDSGEYSSQCPNPGHNGGSGDQQASLRWRQAIDGQVLFHCHAGCEGEDITTTLGVTFVQLRWPRTGYVYLSDLREPLAVHVKAPTAGGKKRFWWEHEENGTSVNGRGTAWEPTLWAWPDLIEANDRAKLSGQNVHLWITEGEKDAHAAACAFDEGWTPRAETPAAGWTHLTTTGPDGAAVWGRELTDQVLSLSPDRITILCDSDEAGIKRGSLITEALLDQSPTVTVDTLSWTDKPGVKDVFDAINRFGSGWLREASKTDEADPYRWPSVNTGWLYEAEAADSDGNLTGQFVMHRVLSPGTKQQRAEAISTCPIRVIASSVDEDGNYTAWEVDIDRGRPLTIRTEDLTSSAFDVWNAKHQVFIVSRLGSSLGAYLRHHSQNSPRMLVWEHEGWVDEDTFVTGNGVLIGKQGLIGRPAAGPTQWFYGEAGEAEAAQHITDVLTFRPLGESAPVVAWLAAVAVRPRALAACGSSFVPLLQVPGDSGTGKTTFLRLATRLFGNSGREVSNVTSAGLVRTMSLTTQTLWLDDFANYDDVIADLIRGGLTGGGRTRGTTTSERGVVRDEARASLLNSGETAMGLDERAMVQRSVVVEFRERVQGRTTRKAGEQHKQWVDMLAMGANKDDEGNGLSRWAGSIVRGLWEASKRIENGQATLPLDEDLETARRANDGVREASAWRFVEYGAEVLAEWLHSQGVEADRCAKLRQVVCQIATERIADARMREQSGADMHLVQAILPKFFRAHASTYDSGVVGRLRPGEELTPDSVSRAISDAWKLSSINGGLGGPVRGAVQILNAREDGDDQVLAVAISVHDLETWVGSQHARNAGVGTDRRFVTKQALGSQVRTISNKNWKHGGASEGKVRVRIGSSRPHYSVVTDPDVIRTMLGN